MHIFNLFLAGVLALSSVFSGSYESRLGVTIATTSQSDTIGTFRTNVNTSLENIKTDLESVSSTQGTYGTIVVENTPLATNKGGTGTSTLPTDGKILSANGSTPTWKTLTSDGSITIATTTTSTQISTAGVNTAANFNWTGVHTFSAGVTSTATTTLATTTMTGTLQFGTVYPTATTSTTPTDDNLITKYYADQNYSGAAILNAYTETYDNIPTYPSFMQMASSTYATGRIRIAPTFYDRFYVPKAGSISNLSIKLLSNLDLTSFTCYAVVNGSTSTLSVALPSGSSFATNTTTTVSVSAGDYITGSCIGVGVGTSISGTSILRLK